MMRILFLFVFALGVQVVNCQSYKKSSNKFKENCSALIEPTEKLKKSWYHYVVTQKTNKDYVLRVFYPQTNQTTTYETYKTKRLKNKNGPAKYWFENGNKKSEGVYVNNKKHGQWKLYDIDSGKLSSEGTYTYGKQQGEWRSFSDSGWIKSTTNFQNDIRVGEFIEYDSLSNITNQGEYREDTIYRQSKIDTSATLVVKETMPFLRECRHIVDIEKHKICSDSKLIKHIYENMSYPKEARKYGIEGKAYGQFAIDKTGNIIDVKILISHCDQIKQELIRIIKSLPEFDPGLQNGEAVKVLYTLPFTFRLE